MKISIVEICTGPILYVNDIEYSSNVPVFVMEDMLDKYGKQTEDIDMGTCKRCEIEESKVTYEINKGEEKYIEEVLVNVISC